MAVVQISKIQHRRGKAGSSAIPQLASAELGWAIDTQKLYIGNGAVSEGAPGVGNTEILTEKSNIFELLSTYTYKGPTDVIKQTGEFIAEPIKRTLQQRLDDIVSIKSFGAKGDGIQDDTKALQRAIDQLFINTDKADKRTRVGLKIDAGEYKITDTIFVPPFATILGDGKNKTTIKLYTNPNDLNPTARPIFQTVDGTSTPGTYVKYSNIQNSTRPKHIVIKGMTLEVDSAVAVHDAILKADCLTESLIDGVEFVSDWQKDDGYDSTKCGIEFRAIGATTSENVIIQNSEFRMLSVGIFSVQDVRTITVNDSYFDFMQVGIDLARTSTGSGNQSLGPRHFIVKNNKFNRIMDFGFAVHKPVSTLEPIGHISNANIFLDVGNNMNGQDSPQTSVIKFASPLCESIGDTFERESEINKPTLLSVPFKPLVDGYHYTKGKVNEFSLAEVDALTTFSKLPFTDKKIAYVDYLIVKTTGQATTRQGRLTITIQDNTNINVTDNFSHTGSSDGGVEFGAVLDDLDSTAGSETVNIQYRNLIGNGVGTLTYAISYFA
tara:strand:+ start:344 stop:1996 length:1653 start_codon:yes stop_codon:yes gene_type:complete